MSSRTTTGEAARRERRRLTSEGERLLYEIFLDERRGKRTRAHGAAAGAPAAGERVLPARARAAGPRSP